MPTLEEKVEKSEERINTIEQNLEKIEYMLMRVLYIQQETEIKLREYIEEGKKDRQEWKEKLEEEKKIWNERFEQERLERLAKQKEWENRLERDIKEMNREWNKRWGKLSNKLGTIVEDIIFPATEPVLTSYFKCSIDDLQLNRMKKKGDLKDEFDVIAVSEECKTVFLIEVKATPKVEYINDFKDKKVERFKQLFDEYKDYNLVLIFASLRLKDDIVNYLTKNGIYAMAYREWEYMDLLNFEELYEGEEK